MADVVTRNVDRKAPSAAVPAWVSLGIGMLICLCLFVIAVVLVLSLIPLYLKTKNVTVANTGNSVSLSPSFSSGSSLGGSSTTVTNHNEIGQQLSSHLQVNSNSLNVKSVTVNGQTSSASGRRRRQTTSSNPNMEHCNSTSANSTIIEMDIATNSTHCGGDAACIANHQAIIVERMEVLDSKLLILRFDDGTSAHITVKRCKKFNTSNPEAARCRSCQLNFDDGSSNFFIGDLSASNTTVINPTPNYNVTYNITDYVGYPTASYTGSCYDLCRILGSICDSNYANCANRGAARYNTCNVFPSNTTCPGISIYNDPNGNLGGARGAPISCRDSTDYCCCLRPS